MKSQIRWSTGNVEINRRKYNFNSSNPYKGNYIELFNNIKKDGYKHPTFKHVVFFLDEIIQKCGHNTGPVHDYLFTSFVYGFTTGLYLQDSGIYFEDHPKVESGRVIMNRTDLEKRLNQGDPDVRFFSFEEDKTISGRQHPKTLSENPFLIALAGEEASKKLGEMSRKFDERPEMTTNWDWDETVSSYIFFPYISAQGGMRIPERLEICSLHRFDAKGYSFGYLN